MLDVNPTQERNFMCSLTERQPMTFDYAHYAKCLLEIRLQPPSSDFLEDFWLNEGKEVMPTVLFSSFTRMNVRQDYLFRI